MYSQGAASVWGTGLSGGAPDSVRCARLPRPKRPLSGFSPAPSAKIHRTVRCAPDCPVSQRSAGPTVGRAICVRHVAEPTVGRGHRTVRCAPDMSGVPTAPDLQRSASPIKERNRAPDTVRCARLARAKWPLSGIHRRRMAIIHRTCSVRQRLSGYQWSTAPFLEGNRAPDSVRCAPDCPVRPTTEGKDGLPDLLSTAPSCLGAIKGTPRRMEENTKQP